MCNFCWDKIIVSCKCSPDIPSNQSIDRLEVQTRPVLDGKGHIRYGRCLRRLSLPVLHQILTWSHDVHIIYTHIIYINIHLLSVFASLLLVVEYTSDHLYIHQFMLFWVNSIVPSSLLEVQFKQH